MVAQGAVDSNGQFFPSTSARHCGPPRGRSGTNKGSEDALGIPHEDNERWVQWGGDGGGLHTHFGSKSTVPRHLPLSAAAKVGVSHLVGTSAAKGTPKSKSRRRKRKEEDARRFYTFFGNSMSSANSMINSSTSRAPADLRDLGRLQAAGSGRTRTQHALACQACRPAG